MFDFKKASKKELKNEYDKIAKKIGDDQFFTSKELNFLPEILLDGEQVLAFTSGIMNTNTWLITLTDIRIIFLDKGMIYGLKQSVIPLDKVQNITGETGILFGKIQISDGSTTHKITMVWKKTVKIFTNMVQEQIQKLKNPSSQKKSDTNSDSKSDPMAKLEKLAALLDKGILTKEEFAAEKKKLLNK